MLRRCDLTDNGPYVFSMLLALSCDPDEVALVHEVQSTLRILTTALSKDQLYATRLLESLRDRPVSDQYYALSLQPFGTQSQRQTAQSVSFALLFQKVRLRPTLKGLANRPPRIRVRRFQHYNLSSSSWQIRLNIRISMFRRILRTTPIYTTLPCYCKSY